MPLNLFVWLKQVTVPIVRVNHVFNNEKQLITVLPVHQWRRSAARSRVFTPRGCQASPNTRSTLSPGNSTYTHVKSSCFWSGMRCYTVCSQIRRFVLSHTPTPDIGYLPRVLQPPQVVKNITLMVDNHCAVIINVIVTSLPFIIVVCDQFCRKVSNRE